MQKAGVYSMMNMKVSLKLPKKLCYDARYGQNNPKLPTEYKFPQQTLNFFTPSMSHNNACIVRRHQACAN